jgi:hypothetical protein
MQPAASPVRRLLEQPVSGPSTPVVPAPPTAARQRPYRIVDRGSLASHVLESVWQDLRRLVPGLPFAVIVLLCAGARSRAWGHFARSCWAFRKDRAAHEIGLNPALFHQPEDLLATLMHEAAHAWLFARTGNGGCGSTKYYHRKTFRDAARELGLLCEWRNSRYGWTSTRWPESGVPPRYAPLLERLHRELPLGTASQPAGIARPPAGVMPPKGWIRLQCACPRSIHVAKKTAEAGGIVCRHCGADFTRIV